MGTNRAGPGWGQGEKPQVQVQNLKVLKDSGAGSSWGLSISEAVSRAGSPDGCQWWEVLVGQRPGGWGGEGREEQVWHQGPHLRGSGGRSRSSERATCMQACQHSKSSGEQDGP